MSPASRLLRSAVVFGLLLVPTARHAFAGDGVIELNQACAAVGCHPTDDPGFPIQVGSGSYRLTSNLVVSDPDTSAVELRSSPTTLDLNGFQILGPYQCAQTPPTCPGGTGWGIEGLFVRFLTVRNGFVVGFGAGGVYLPGAESLVEDLAINDMGGDGLVIGTGGVARNNRVDRVAGDGIHVTLEFGGSRMALIEGNVIRAGGDGVDAGGGLVLGNSIRSDSSVAIRLDSAGYGRNFFIGSTNNVGGLSFGDNSCGGVIC